MSERERIIHGPEEDVRRIITHFKLFLLNIHPDEFPESYSNSWKEMVEKMFREPTPEESAEAETWQRLRNDNYYMTRLPRDITPVLLQAYHGGTDQWLRARFVTEAMQNADIFSFTAHTPEYIQTVMNYEFPYDRVFGEGYPVPPQSPLTL